MQIELPYPHKILWPNGRTKSHGWRNSEFQKHKGWAKNATLAELRGGRILLPLPERFRVLLTVYPKTANLPDKDNCLSAAKSAFDGIADALKVNDSRFDYAPVQIAEPTRFGKFIITLEGA